MGHLYQAVQELLRLDGSGHIAQHAVPVVGETTGIQAKQPIIFREKKECDLFYSFTPQPQGQDCGQRSDTAQSTRAETSRDQCMEKDRTVPAATSSIASSTMPRLPPRTWSR